MLTLSRWQLQWQTAHAFARMCSAAMTLSGSRVSSFVGAHSAAVCNTAQALHMLCRAMSEQGPGSFPFPTSSAPSYSGTRLGIVPAQ